LATKGWQVKQSFKQYQALLGKYLRPYRWRVVALAALLFASIGLQLVSPQVLRRFIDLTRDQGPLRLLVQAALIYLIAGLVHQGLVVVATYIGNDLGWRATNGLRGDLAEHCLGLSMSFHKRFTPGKMIERIDGDVLALANFFSQFVIRIIGSILLLVGILIALYIEDWRLGLGLTAYSGIVLYLLNFMRESAVSESETEREESANLYGFIEERLASRDDIRANGAGAYAMRRFYQEMRKYTDRCLTAWIKRSFIWVAGMSLFYVGRIAAFGVGGWLYYRGQMSLGSVYALTHYLLMLFGPLETLVHQLQDLQKAIAGLRRVRDLLMTTERMADAGRFELEDGALALAFENVTFIYDDGDEPVLENIGFELVAGRSLGLLGRTGSGKTTLSRLLFRFYDPSTGRVWLNGVPIADLSLAGLRRHVGMVTQEVQLFKASVRENLTLFDDTVRDDRILSILKELGLGDWLARLPDGLDTQLEAGGSGLSAGEGQLLAFARVFLKDPGLVVLDEPSSCLDPATERLIEQAMNRLLCGRTAIIIAHRLATVERVDDIMIMESGRIAEHGRRSALEADASSLFSGLLRTGIEESIV